ncbi:zinc ribbon domain-containing protein [Arundinibacter roseus]|uniref:Uncharacterized protein n=1 Tax=Arundinibacter roseus TaxID=2070510 RepID=A0A4R4KIN8_9BACT|nr:zinc ribbon domain-containing protein [Arundinibacter roseus]TDB68090.1 hypothetical protein EZE20_03985 [Arundinibacter roseus]
MKKKECPSCAMNIDAASKTCPICQYEFPVQSKWLQWTAILLAALFLYFMLFR